MKPEKVEGGDGGNVVASASVEGWLTTVMILVDEERAGVLSATDSGRLSEDGQEVRVTLTPDLWDAVERAWQEAEGAVSS